MVDWTHRDGGGLFPRLQGFGENVQPFIPHLHFFFLKWRLACIHNSTF